MRRWMIAAAAMASVAGCAGNDAEPRRTAGTEPAAPVSAGADGGSCFAPLAGHPTSEERQAFVAEVSRLATRAEEQHGVPAAAVAAMAIQESGYGWTELARQTNDILAWKYTTAAAVGGRDFWVLDCGTSEDRYIMFDDRPQAVDFVAKQLATSDNYAAATRRYREERDRGVDVVVAVDRWVDDIADPYSTQPEAYRRAIRRVMNDPLDPSDQQSRDRSLYRLSEMVQTARSTP